MPAGEAASASPGGASAPLWERAFLVGALLAQQDAFLNLLRIARGADSADPSGDVGAVDPVSSALVFLTLAALAGLSLLHRRQVVAVARRNGLALALVGVAFLSTVWSVEPATTAKRAVVYLVSLGLPLYMAARLGLDGGLRVAATAFAIAAGASLAVGVAAPSIGIMHFQGLEGTWRGVFSHKNPLAQGMLLGLMAQAYVLALGPRRGLSAGIMAVEMLLILLSRSFTALVVGVIALAAYGLFLGVRRGGALRRTLILAGPLALAAAAAAVIYFPASVEAASGKDATLTGRTELWSSVWAAIGERPFTGWGFQAFWTPGNPRAEALWRQIGWIAPNAHNGVLDVWLGLGPLGVGLTLAIVVQAFTRGGRLMREPRHRLAAAAVLILASAVLFRSVTEASLARQSEVDWIMFNFVSFAAAGLLAARSPDARRKAAGGIMPRARPLDAAPSGLASPQRRVPLRQKVREAAGHPADAPSQRTEHPARVRLQEQRQSRQREQDQP